MLSGSKVKWHGKNTEWRAAHHCNKKIHAAKSQLQLHLVRTMGDKMSVLKRVSIKRVFSNILMAKGSIEIISASYRIKIVISQTGTWARQRYLIQFLPLSAIWMADQGDLSALSWRAMIVRMISSHLILKLCEISCCSWIPANIWGLIQVIQETSNSFLMSSRNYSQWYLNNLDRSQLAGNYLMFSQFPRRAKRMSLETTGLSVSLQCLVKLQKIVLGSTGKHLEDTGSIITFSMRGKSGLSNLVSFYDRITHLVNQQKPVNAVFFFIS